LKNEYGAVITKNSNGKLYYEDDTYSIEKSPLDEEDKILLDIAFFNFRVFSNSPIFGKFEKTINKILTGDAISKIERNRLDCIQPEFHKSAVGSEHIEPILNAILEHNAIEIEYQKEGQEPEVKVISPYVLKQVNSWYMVGFDHLKTSLIKNYSLDKILSIKVSKEPYHYYDNFDASEFFKYSFGIFHSHKSKPQKIKLAFKEPYINQLINYPLSPYQTNTLSKDGKTLTVNLELYESYEIIEKILSFGASVKVLAPSSLAKKIKGITKEVLRGYNKNI
jgi:predicted DNA-binding transcriptional regulator YafY